MTVNRFAALATAIGMVALLTGCSGAQASTEGDSYAVADKLESQISEFTGVQLARVKVDSPHNSWANVAVRFDFNASSADKQATLVKVGELLLAEPTFSGYQLQASFDSPHDLPLGSTFVVPYFESVDQLKEESELWLTITATVPAVGIVQFSADGPGGPGVHIIPDIRTDGTVPTEDEIEAIIDEVVDLPSSFHVVSDGTLPIR